MNEWILNEHIKENYWGNVGTYKHMYLYAVNVVENKNGGNLVVYLQTLDNFTCLPKD